jgi:hypothetical protein
MNDPSMQQASHKRLQTEGHITIVWARCAEQRCLPILHAPSQHGILCVNRTM